MNMNSVAFKLTVFIKVHYYINKYQVLFVLMFGYSLISQEYLSRIFYRSYTLRNQKEKDSLPNSNFTVQHVKYRNKQIITSAVIKKNVNV